MAAPAVLRLPSTRLPPVVAVVAVVVVGFLAAAATRSPVQTLVGVAALAFVAVSARRPEYALLLLVATGPLEGAFPSVPITKLAGALAFGSFAVNAVVTRRRISFDPSHGTVLLILAIALVSSTLALDTPIAVTTTIRYASFVGLYVIVSQTIGDRRLQRRIAWVLVLAAAAAGVYALSNFVSGTTTIAELAGTTADDIGFLLATTIPIAFWLLGSRTLVKPLVVVVVGVLVTALVLSFARGAMLGLAAGILWQVVIERRHVRLLLAGAVAGGLIALVVVHQNSAQVSSGLLLKQKVAASNVSTRLEAWNAAANLAVKHPFVGIGPGNFRDYYYSATGRPPGSQPRLAVVHNAYLDIAAELGFGAMILFLAYLAIAFSRLGVAVREGLGQPGFASAVRTSLVVAAVGSLTLTEQYFPQFWLFGGLATALWAERRRTEALSAVVETAEGNGVPAPVAASGPAYDHEVAERRIEGRERRVNAQFEAIRSQRERLARRAGELTQLEDRARRATAELERAERAHSEAAAELRARTARLAARDADLAERLREIEERELRLLVVERELAAREASLEEPLGSSRRRAWNLLELEQAVARLRAVDAARADELKAYLPLLREYAASDGGLPETLDPLLQEVFGDLSELDRPGSP